MNRASTLATAIAIGCVGAACTDTEITDVPVVLGDPSSFANHVQDYVGLACGSLDCHGDAGRFLRLYAQDGLRLESALRFTDISPEEIRLNVESFAGVSPNITDVTEHLALLKGLGVSAGGYAHEGRDVWDTKSDDGYQCLIAWLEERLNSAQTQQACNRATAVLQ